MAKTSKLPHKNYPKTFCAPPSAGLRLFPPPPPFRGVNPPPLPFCMPPPLPGISDQSLKDGIKLPAHRHVSHTPCSHPTKHTPFLGGPETGREGTEGEKSKGFIEEKTGWVSQSLSSYKGAYVLSNCLCVSSSSRGSYYIIRLISRVYDWSPLGADRFIRGSFTVSIWYWLCTSIGLKPRKVWTEMWKRDLVVD